MPEKKKTIATSEEIAHFLAQTGFVFEMRMTELLSKSGYACEINPSFYDLEGDTEREIDIVASKSFPNEVNVHFVIECKQSVMDKWIFICTKGNLSRFYMGVKHLPTASLEMLKNKDLFSHFHNFDRKIPLGHNYICYSSVTSKKTDHLQIDECVYKLPKALADLASRSEGGRHVFFPVALFSGQIFTVGYRDSLIVKEVPFLQYFRSFRSEAYNYGAAQILQTSSVGASMFDWEHSRKMKRAAQIRATAFHLSRAYHIDFVTESGLPDYLTMVEKAVASVQTANWPLPTQEKSGAATETTPTSGG